VVVVATAAAVAGWRELSSVAEDDVEMPMAAEEEEGDGLSFPYFCRSN
jgi:hypothetical protein